MLAPSGNKSVAGSSLAGWPLLPEISLIQWRTKLPLSEQKNEQKTMKTSVSGWTNTDEKRNGFPYFRRRPFSTHCLISKLQLQREGVTPALKKTNAIFRFEQSIAKMDWSADILVPAT